MRLVGPTEVEDVVVVGGCGGSRMMCILGWGKDDRVVARMAKTVVSIGGVALQGLSV